MAKKSLIEPKSNYWFKLLMRSLIAMVLLSIISSMFAFSSFIWVESVNNKYKPTQLNILGKIIIAAGRAAALSVNQISQVASSSAAMITKAAKPSEKNSFSEVFYSLKNKLTGSAATSTKPRSPQATSTVTKTEITKTADIGDPSPVKASSTDIIMPISPVNKAMATTTATSTIKSKTVATTTTVKTVEEPIAGANNPPPTPEPPAEALTPPDTTIIVSPPGLASSTQANFTIDASLAGCTFEYKLNNGAWLATGKTLQLSGLATGTQAILFRAKSSSNGVDASPIEYSWTIDTEAPIIAVNSLPDRYAATSSAFFGFSANEQIVAWYFKLDAGPWLATTSQSLNFDNLTEDDHILRLYGIDSVGLFSAQRDIPWFVDLTQPTAYIDPLQAEFDQGGFELTYYGLDNQAQHGGVLKYELEYDLDGSGWQAWLNDRQEEAAIFDINIYPGQEVSFRIKAYDQAGHASEWSETANTKIASPNPNYLLISEIQFSGITPDDEFIELYNPTSQAILLENFTLDKKNPAGEVTEVVADFSSIQIDAHRYLLLASENYDGSIAADIVYSGDAIENIDTIILMQNGAVLDKFGSSGAIEFEGTAFAETVGDHQSVERKAVAKATSASMGTGGLYQYRGNSFDTDNNAFDFVLLNQPDSQNIDSAEETIASVNGFQFVWNNTLAVISGFCRSLVDNWLNGNGLRLVSSLFEGAVNQARTELWSINNQSVSRLFKGII